VSHAGLAEKVLPLHELASEIDRRVRAGSHPAGMPSPARTQPGGVSLQLHERR
jgi:hypothetical protein